MKKILSILVASVMLVAALSLCVSAGTSSVAPLTAEIFNVTSDAEALYVEFSEPVAAPGADVMLSLVACGWPAGDALRYTRRCDSTSVTAVNDTVWKFDTIAAGVSNAEAKSWFVSGDINYEGPLAVDNTNGGGWMFMLFGDVKSKDGKKSLAKDMTKNVADASLTAGSEKNGYVLETGFVAKNNGYHASVQIKKVENVAALNHVFTTAYRAEEDINWIYLVFSEPVTPGEGFSLKNYQRFQWGGAQDIVACMLLKTDKLEKVDEAGCVYKVSNQAYLDANYCASALDPTAEGFFPAGEYHCECKLALTGAVTSASGKNLIFTDKDDSDDTYAGRYHDTSDGLNFMGGITLTDNFYKVEKIADIPGYPSPATADMTSVVAVVAVVALAGAAIVCKKH